ncbi:MAG: ABC transporter ATP-binding protein [Treponema sp.]|jgi:branched-chain amino acid transport system ATP-binding protein|nr:ABC transporter ATP-binding protein [Treponema sp.]
MVILETRNLSKQFGGLKAVNDISMQVREGEVFGIIGPNGAGKTTFFNLITASLRPSEGEILYKGQNINRLPAHKIARLGIARTYQNIKLFRYLNVLENVKVGFHTRTSAGFFDALFHTGRFRSDEKTIAEQGAGLLKKTGLADRAEMPAGNLPYGLQRRLEIARALALSPKLLLLDEPAAGMNPRETEDLMRFIKNLNSEGITVIVIEHDMKFIMNLCDRIFVINSGQKLAEGTPPEVTVNPLVIEAYLGAGLVIRRRKKKEAAQ